MDSIVIKPTSEEIKLPADAFLVSKMDPKSNITYCNDQLLRYSGYDESELLGKPLKIIRHPGVPRSLVRFMWQTIQQQQEFFAVVKNLCKDGAYYWSFLSTVPSFDKNNQISGYFSVRRQASQELIDIMTPIYQDMIAEEAKYSDDQQLMDASIKILDAALEHYKEPYSEFIFKRGQ